MEAVEVKSVSNLVPELLKVPYSRIWTVYDKEADVLYLNFKKPSPADDSELTDDDLLIRYEKMRALCDLLRPGFTKPSTGYLKL